MSETLVAPTPTPTPRDLAERIGRNQPVESSQNDPSVSEPIDSEQTSANGETSARSVRLPSWYAEKARERNVVILPANESGKVMTPEEYRIEYERQMQQDGGEQVEDAAESDDRLKALDDARSAWASISTKRQSRMFDRRIHGYNDAKEQYDRLVQETGREQLRDSIEAASTQTEKNAIVIGYLADEQNKLREQIHHETDAKFINKFATFMNRGSRKARIAKGVLLGLVVGTGGSLALGAVGAVGAAGLAAGASRFVRGYTARHSAGMEQLSESQLSSAKSRINLNDNTHESVIDHSTQIFRDYFEADTKREQSKLRKAFAWGAGSVAVGATVGHVLHLGMDQLHVREKVDLITASVTGEDIETQAPLPADTPTEPIIVEPPHASVDSSAPDVSVADSTPAAAPTSPHVHELMNVHDSYTIKSGEGWRETLKEMGIPKTEWAEVMRDAGPKLEKQGWAYLDKTSGEYRIAHTGTLSEQAMQTLKNASAKAGYAFSR